MQAMAMPLAHRPSQSGQWQQLQSQWEQHQQYVQQQQHDQQRQAHDLRYYHPAHQQHQQQHDPYNDYYTDPNLHHSAAYPPHHQPPPPAHAPIPPLLLRIAVSPTRTEDLPIDVTASTDVAGIARQFCATHGIAGDSKLEKLQAMVQRSVEQHRQQYAVADDYYPPHGADAPYEQAYGAGYYDEQQAYADQYGGQYMATTPSPHALQRVAESEDPSSLQPTFTPSRPTSAMSHTTAMQHSRHASSSMSSFSHSQPTPSLRPSGLTLPSSSGPSPRSYSSPSPRPVSPHSAGYLNAPASTRLYANAAVKQRQLMKHQQQKQQLEHERHQEELQHCTFTPQVNHTAQPHSGAQTERRAGRKQYEWIEDWNGEKRGRRLQHMQATETKRIQAEECSFTPVVNAVSQQLAQLSKANPIKKQSSKADAARAAAEEAGKKKQQQAVLDKAAKAKVAQFLQRTVERQQLHKQALQRLQSDTIKDSTPTFAPTITTKAQAAQPAYNKPAATAAAASDSSSTAAVAPVVSASTKKRERKCDEIYRCWADADGYMERRQWVKLVKCWYEADTIGPAASGRLASMRWQLDMDDVAVVQMIIRECDRQVRRDRKAGKAAGGADGGEEEWTWQLSLADCLLWMERLWSVVLNRAKVAEKDEGRMMAKFISTPDMT